MRYFNCRGFLLRKQISGENDYFLTIFSPEGKLQGLSRGSRKITSQKGGHLDILNLCQFQLYKNGQNYLVTECKVENAFQGLKNSLENSFLALTGTEIILKSLQCDQDNGDLFKIFHNFLQELEKRSPSHSNTPNCTLPATLCAQLLLEEFKIKTLKAAGSWPDLCHCHFCENKWLEKEQIWTDLLGQLTCQNCLKNNQNQLQIIDLPIIKLANYLAHHSLQNLSLRITSEELFQLQKLTTIFLNHYLQQELKSDKILKF